MIPIVWNDWELGLEVKDSAGLAMRDVRFKGVRFLHKASVPVIRVKYKGDDCGPYNDKLDEDCLATFTDCNDQEICVSDFEKGGHQWLDMRIGAHIGAYRIQQAWQLSDDGRIAARTWSRGVSCSTDHVHHPYFRFDFDIAPGEKNQVFHRFGDPPRDWHEYTVETARRKDVEGRIDLFARGDDGALWSRQWDGKEWSDWGSLGGQIKGAPAAVSKNDERVDVFVRGTDDRIYQKIWKGGMRRTWSGFNDIGGNLASSPAVASWAADRLDLFARGPGNDLMHKLWDGEDWGNWHSHGASFKGAPAVVPFGHERFDVFVRGTDDHMHHLWNSHGTWHGWEDLGGSLASEPTVCSWKRGERLDCFARGPGGDLLHKSFDGDWGDWHSHGGEFKGAPTAVSWGKERLDIFVRAMNDRVSHLWFDHGDWHGWEDLGAPKKSGGGVALGSSPAAASRSSILNWVITNPDSDHAAVLWPGDTDGRAGSFVTADFGIRRYHSDEDDEWPFGCWEGLGWDNNEDVSDRDIVVWYVAHLGHHAHGEAKGSLGEWIVGGPTIQLSV